MSQSEVVEIPYHLIADPNAPEVSPSGSGQANPQDTRRNITVPGTHTIYDLYNELIQTLRDTHRFITIQFPCTVPEPNPNGEHEEDHQNPSHTERAPEWKDLVGHSGYQYDPSLKIEDLQSCWPRQEVHTKLQPIQVVAIPKDRVETLPHLADETEEQLKSRLHLMGSMYDLFYAQRKGRVIWMPTLDSQFETPRKVWIRSCWQEFQIGIIANFMRIHSKKTYKKKDLKKLKKRYFADKCHQPSTDDTELWKSIQETPEWIARDGADVSPFRGLINSETLIDNDCCKAFYLNGQPGTGKSLMLLYLIHCLMKEVDKVSILYILPDMPVITILVDRSNISNPIRIRSHIPSLGETWYTNDFPVIRIVDSADPFANKAMQGVFTVYAASPAKYEIQVPRPDHETPEWRGNYPLWTEGEFYTMMRCLKKTGREHWIRPVDADLIVGLHPLVITLLGTHGYLEDETDTSSDDKSDSQSDDGSDSQSDDESNSHSDDGSDSSSDGKESFDARLGFLQFIAMNGSTLERIHSPLPSEMELDLNAHFPDDDMYVYLNVIEVFGLSPRALSADLNDTFEGMSEAFGWGGITLTGSEASVVLSSLTASHLGSRPVSQFASRLLLTMTKIKAEGFLKKIGGKTIPEAFRSYILEHKVNQELLRSHSRFTLYSTTPHLFPTSYCTFPVIDRCALTSSQLNATQRFSSNVLYYESPSDSETNKDQKSWTGIHSFIFFHNKDSIKLFTFHTAVNSKSEDVNYRLIEKLKNVLEIQHAKPVRGKGKKEGMRKAKVEVFFVLIAKPEDVLPFIDRNTVFQDTKKKNSSGYGSYRTGVVSVSDLLFYEFSGLEGPVTKRPKIVTQWNTDDDDFRKCFVMTKEQTLDPRHPQGISMQPVLPSETTPEPRSVLMVDPHHQLGMTVQPFDDDTEASPSDVESDDLNDLEEEVAGEDILPPRQETKARSKNKTSHWKG